MSRKPCNVKKCDREPDAASFFQKTGKFIILFVVLGIVAAFLTILTVSIAVLFGGAVPIYPGYVYWDYNVFITYVIGFVVTPVIILYVMQKRKEALGY